MGDGRFQKGQHWRPRREYWEREWLYEEYITKQRSAENIAAQFSITENAILFWLGKHKIPTRSVSDVRKIKHWGAAGEKNPMFGKTGVLNPNWRGGLTPLRQQFYSRPEWKKLVRDVRKRDKYCRLCSSDEKLEIHHIEPFSQAPLLVMDIGNVILLCHKCHKKMQRKENRWRKKLYALIEEGGSTQYEGNNIGRGRNKPLKGTSE
jgi:hypothetical protein